MDKLTPEQMCRVAELVTGNKRHEVLNGEVVIYEFLGGRSAHRSNINIIELFSPAFDGTDQQQAQACKVLLYLFDKVFRHINVLTDCIEECPVYPNEYLQWIGGEPSASVAINEDDRTAMFILAARQRDMPSLLALCLELGA